jgi:hypothetical protein
MSAASIGREIENEFYRAQSRFPAFNSAHEGYTVILEESDELWAEVKDNKRTPDEYIKAMRGEAVQVAAMALRFIHDVCDNAHITQDRTTDA